MIPEAKVPDLCKNEAIPLCQPQEATQNDPFLCSSSGFIDI
jgi:hypothetical protein